MNTLDKAKDYYKILGIGKNATNNKIKKAYKNLARKYHPDLNKDAKAEEKFKEVNEAFQILNDKDKRREYDLLGNEGYQKRHNQQRTHHNGPSIDDILRDAQKQMDDFLRSQGFDQPQQQRPKQTKYKKSTKSKGEIRKIIDMFETQKKYAKVFGRVKSAISQIFGSGENLQETVDFSGLEYVVENRRDVYLNNEIPLSFPDIAIGTKVKVITLGIDTNGYVLDKGLVVRINPGMTTPKTLRLKKKGINGGHMYVTFVAESPKKLSREERELYRKLKEIEKS